MSITSVNIRKIIFAPHAPGDKWSYRRWSYLDTVLPLLVDRLHTSGYEHTLELEFRQEFECAEIDLDVGLDALFPEFRKRGRVRILEVASGKTLYCSDR